MPTLPTLRRTFQRAIASAVVTMPALSGCTPPGIQKDPDFVPAHCEGGVNLWLSGLMPDEPVDYLELTSSAYPDRAEREGQACKSATLIAACEAKLSELRTLSPWVTGLSLVSSGDNQQQARLLVTRGDDVFAIDSGERLAALLGKIDSPEEAMFLVQTQGHDVRCKGGGARPADDGFEVQAYLSVGCGGLDRFLYAVHYDGRVERLDKVRLEDPERGCVVGRRPAGLRSPASTRCRSAGEYLARAATLEAASVAAFRRLAQELSAQGAPARLVSAALAAARDEVRHARSTARLSLRLGVRAQEPEIAATPARTLEEIARENAQEGCVRETFGALEGQWMALHAGDVQVRRAYRRIARDELRHAALSWRVARWIEPRLTPGARERVCEARRDAIADLRVALTEEPSAEIRALCGVPSAQAARALFEEIAPMLG